MSGMHAVDPAARDVTDAILAIPEVRGLFPHSTVAAAVGVLIGASSVPASALVEIERTAAEITISARLAINATASSSDVAVAARRAVGNILGSNQHVVLHVQIAHID